MKVFEISNVKEKIGDLKRGQGCKTFETGFLEWVFADWAI